MGALIQMADTNPGSPHWSVNMMEIGKSVDGGKQNTPDWTILAVQGNCTHMTAQKASTGTIQKGREVEKMKMIIKREGNQGVCVHGCLSVHACVDCNMQFVEYFCTFACVQLKFFCFSC